MDLTIYCSIDNVEGICLPVDIIKKIERNEKIGDGEKIEDKLESIKTDLGCMDEVCVLKRTTKLNETEKNELLFKFFKPIASVDPVKWLSNSHLDQLQEQLHNIHPNYYYSFIHMIDMVMISHEHTDILGHEILELSKIDFVNEMSEQSDQRIISTNESPLQTYGVIFNTDPSHKSGQHWFSLFFDFRTKGTLEDPYTLEYFNSAGTDLKKNVYDYLIKLSNTISFATKKVCNYVQVTNIQHQSSKTGNCGAYSLYYIHQRINGVKKEEFNDPNYPLNDDTITEFRKIIFIDEKRV